VTASSTSGSADHLFGLGFDNHRAGRLKEAEMLYRRVLEIDRAHADTWHALGLVAVQTGHPADALSLFKQAIALSDANPEFHNNLGMAYLDTGNTSRAVKAFQRALEIAPEYEEGWFNLGAAEARRSDYDAAAKAFARTLEVAPDNHDARRNLAGVLKRAGRPAEAAAPLDVLLAASPDDAGLIVERAEAALAAGERRAALAFAERALALAPEDPKRIGFAVRIRALAGDPLGASRAFIEGYRKIVAKHPDDAASLSELANALNRDGASTEARALLERACQVAPEHDLYRYNLTVVRQQFGDRGVVDDFAALAAREDSPVAARAFYAMVDQTPDAETDARLERARTWLARPDLPTRDRASLEFARGRILDRLGRHDDAFAAYASANAARRAETSWDAAGQRAFVDRILETFETVDAPVPSGGPRGSARPVFVVGMPRSGTTLIEQVLGAHRDVFAAGELTYFTELVPRLGFRFGRDLPFPEVVRALDEAELDEIATEYLGLLAARDPDASLVVDKMPYNFLHVGFLARLFPRARFILTSRTPAAIAWSIFSNDFVGRHPYANALDSIGVACANEARLAAHWQACLPARVTALNYERFVSDFGGELARILAFLELPPDPACLDFHRQNAVVRTASNWQVRQPLYQSSMDKWRRYEAHLAPFFVGFGTARPAE